MGRVICAAAHEGQSGSCWSRCTAATTRSSTSRPFRRLGSAASGRPGPRRPSARQPSSDGESGRASRERVSADHAGVVGMVGDDAAAEARRALGDVRLPARARARSIGQVTIDATAERRRDELHDRDALHRARRPASSITRTGQGARLHRLPVARPEHARGRHDSCAK